MSLFTAHSISHLGRDTAGIAGNIFAIGLFVSPIPTFRRVIRNGSTEMFSGLPYIYSLLNCLICLWYGTPLISHDNLLLATVNSIGAAFQLVYIILFLIYAEKARKVRMFGLLLAVLGVFVIIVVGSLQIDDSSIRRMFIGFISCASLISMFASPLFIIVIGSAWNANIVGIPCYAGMLLQVILFKKIKKIPIRLVILFICIISQRLVIRTKSVEFMPFYLSLSTFLMSTSFFLYGLFSVDAFIYVPNGIGTVLGMIQLVLYFYYNSSSSENSREPLIV